MRRTPADQSRAILANVVSRESDVRTVLTRVALGEADAGLVYATDVAAAGRGATAVAIPDRLQTHIIYKVAVLKRTTVAGLTQAFLSLTLSAQGQKTLQAHGFLPRPKR